MLLPKDVEQELDMLQTTFTAQVILKHLLKSSFNAGIVKDLLKLVSKYASKQGQQVETNGGIFLQISLC